MNSTVTLYKTKINKSMNALVDDIELYLMQCMSLTIDNFQYIRNDLQIEIKLNMSQLNVDDFDYNYVKIENGSELPAYYFVARPKQVAPQTVQLDLTLDTLNTIGNNIGSPANPRNFEDSTIIQRQHKDRFTKYSGYDPEYPTLYRKIDKKSEGLVVQQFKDSDRIINDKVYNKEIDLDWYLIYKTKGSATPTPDTYNPIEVLLCANQEISTGVPSSGDSRRFTFADFDENKYYYFLDIDNPNGTIDGKVLGSTVTKALTTRLQYNVPVVDSTIDVQLRGFVLKRSGTSLQYTCIYPQSFLIATGTTYESTKSNYGNYLDVVSGQGIAVAGTKWTTVSSVTCTRGNFFRVGESDLTLTSQQPEGIKALVTFEYGIYVGPATAQIVSSIENIDRTDSRLVKIIKYPYCPVDFTLTNNNYYFGTDWTYDNGYVKYNKNNLPDLGKRLGNVIYLNDITKYTVPFTPGYKNKKTVNCESKLLHSDFTNYKLVYDSYSKVIKPEQFTFANVPESNIRIDFKPTNSVNSKFGFKIDYENFGTLSADEDFADVLLTNRNNAETLLNSDYLNYLRTGYYYDNKANELALKQQQVNAGTSTATSLISLIGGILALAAAPTSGGLSAAAGVGLLTGAAGAAVSAASKFTNIQNTVDTQNNSMQAKLAQLQSQSASISGTDDVDLMSWYSGNRLHLMLYKPNSVVIEELYNLFDLTGYSCQEHGIPQVDSRIWYNFIQCNPEIVIEVNENMKQAWVDDLKQKYIDGVTVFHHHNFGGQYDEWNLERKYENWENWVVTGGTNE